MPWSALAAEIELFDPKGGGQGQAPMGAQQPHRSATTPLEFCHLPHKHQPTERIVNASDTLLTAKGPILEEDSVVDATIIDAPSSPRNRSGRKPQRRGSTGSRDA